MGFRSCAAFGDKEVPLPIWEGDNGIRFERADGLPDAIAKRIEELERRGSQQG